MTFGSGNVCRSESLLARSLIWELSRRTVLQTERTLALLYYSFIDSLMRFAQISLRFALIYKSFVVHFFANSFPIFYLLLYFLFGARDVLTECNNEAIAEPHFCQNFPPQMVDLRRKGSRVVVAMAELAVFIRPPSVKVTFWIESCNEGVFRRSRDLNILELNILNTNFLRRFEGSKLTLAPQYNFVTCCESPAEATRSYFSYFVDFQMSQSDWRVELLLLGENGVSHAHLVSLVATHTIYGPWCCQN